MSTTAPRFTRVNRRGIEHELTSPLPSALAALVPGRAAQHAKVAAKLDALRASSIELSRELAASEKADAEEAEAAALEGRNAKRRQKTASLRNRLEECEAEIKRFTDAVQTSADRLLEAAAPFAGQAAEQADTAHQAAITRARELLSAADAAFAEAGELASQRVWLASLDGQRHVMPYRAGAADPGLRQLRAALSTALAEWEQKAAKYQAEAERQRRWEAEHRDEWARQKAAAEKESAASRVVTEGGRIIERGGRPVRRGAFGYEPEEEEPGS